MERVWASRLRWRAMGATQWPAFVLFTVIDGVLVQERPIAGDAPGLVPALLFAGFFNLILVAVGAPLAGRLLRRRRGDMPAVVASDVAGTALLVAGALLIAGLGTAHHSAVARQHAAFADGVRRARTYVKRNAPPEYRKRVNEATSLVFGNDLLRTCVPGDDPDRWWCVFVFTDQDPPGLRQDPNRAPNSSYLPAERG